MTAALLAPLANQGFRVFHDLRVPGSRANIDHLVIGPTGVFAIDSKNLSQRLHVYNGTIWRGRYPYTKKLETTRWAADAAAAALGESVRVAAVQCVHGATVPELDEPSHGVWLVEAGRLTRLIESARLAPLNPEQCSALALRAVSTLGAVEERAVKSTPRTRRGLRRLFTNLVTPR